VALALEGLRLLDLSQGISGPLCSMQLADLGADTIKLEPPSGDWLRALPPFHGDSGESELFLQLNRNKRGIAIDLKTGAGKDVLRRLVEGADILVEGYRPGVMQRLGFGYETVAAYNPRLTYVSISGYGARGPMADLPASELDIQALVGVNRHLGRPTEAPVRYGFDLASAGAGMAAFQGTLAALYWRERTGQGQHVETSLLAALIALVQWALAAEHSPDQWDGRQLRGLTDPPDFGFPTADGPVLMNIRGAEGWIKLLIALDRSDLFLDPRFEDSAKIQANLREFQDVARETLERTPYEDLRRAVQDEIGGTIVRMNDFQTLLESEQVAALDLVKVIKGHQTAGDIRTLDFPWSFPDETLAALRLPPPVLGQHTREVLSELGYAQSEIDALSGGATAGR
jgi:crotonobetainyl-CoA:carnitine CoA-transferase CaiB-like acyl-CoA transferase